MNGRRWSEMCKMSFRLLRQTTSLGDVNLWEVEERLSWIRAKFHDGYTREVCTRIRCGPNRCWLQVRQEVGINQYISATYSKWITHPTFFSSKDNELIDIIPVGWFQPELFRLFYFLNFKFWRSRSPSVHAGGNAVIFFSLMVPVGSVSFLLVVKD